MYPRSHAVGMKSEIFLKQALKEIFCVCEWQQTNQWNTKMASIHPGEEKWQMNKKIRQKKPQKLCKNFLGNPEFELFD